MPIRNYRQRLGGTPLSPPARFPPDQATDQPQERGLGPLRPEVGPGLESPGRPGTAARGSGGDWERCLTELVHYYRHSAVGRRCAGILHQMNSPLQVLSFQLELLEQRSREELKTLQQSPPPPAGPWRPWCDYRLQKLGRCRQEVNDLQAWARRFLAQGLHEETEEKINLDLNRLYAGELELYGAHPFFKHQVTKVFRFQEDLPSIYGHYIDFSQSFRNLIDNALEAMEGAELRVLTVETALEEKHLILLIGDTGVGIPKEVLPRVFAPFFTTKTKPRQPRAGLGLFMARRLLASYGGRIQIYSRPGQTWVTVTLPVGPEQDNCCP